MKYTLKFDSYTDMGIPMYCVYDADGIDPIGEVILLDDHFLVGKDYTIVYHAPLNYIDLTLPLLSLPTVKNACKVMEEVFNYNDADDLLDSDYFKECASLVIGELNL